MILSQEQKIVCENILDTMKECKYQNVLTYRGENENIFIRKIGGFAGTGKTTLISKLRHEIKKEYPKLNIAFITFTGKASSVLKEKLDAESAIFRGDYVGTIHGLVYKALTQWDTTLKTFVVVGWERVEKENIEQHLFIIDEASMVSEEIWNDVLSFNKSVIAIGDHGQLPPVSESSFSLMKEPDFTLTEIHRQALESSIIKTSMFIRENGHIPNNIFFKNNDVFKLSWNNPLCKRIWNEKVTFDSDLIVITGFNKTRANINDLIREKLGCSGLKIPGPGELIICLNNNHDIKIMNGQIGKVMWVMPEEHHLYRITLNINNNVYECMVSDKCFGQSDYSNLMYDKQELKIQKKYLETKNKKQKTIDFFDYGYAISAHKSQGSEWKRVVLFEQRSKHWDDEYYKKWLYTAVTRAKEKLFVISDYWG